MLVRFAGNRDSDAVAAQVLANGVRAVGLVSGHAVRTLLGPSAPLAANGSSGHRILEGLRFMDLTGCEYKGHRLAVAFGAHVHFGAKTALAAT